MGQPQRGRGRPRSEEADAAILRAALEQLLELGAGRVSIEKIAAAAGVTRATVYRRFPGKTELLVQAVESANAAGDEPPSWSSVEEMLTQWAAYLAHPRNRLLLRRLQSATDDHPELLQAYRTAYGDQRAEAVCHTLDAARAAGHLPPGTDTSRLQEMLNGAIQHHLISYPDDTGPEPLAAYLRAMLTLAGYRH